MAATTNPYTLTGTGITQSDTADRDFQTVVASRSHQQENLGELWYLDTSNSTWYKSPAQPIMDPGFHPQMDLVWREPNQFKFALLDTDQGWLTPENQQSPWNLNNAGGYDPLLDEGRKIIWRWGLKCYANLASGKTVTSSGGFGTMNHLTNGNYGDIAASTTNFAGFTTVGAQTVDLTMDLGSIQRIRNTGIRFATKVGTCLLPDYVTVEWSTDNVNWNPWFVRHVGDVDGDWSDSTTGLVVPVIKADADFSARYLRVRVTVSSARTVFMDEWVIQGGNSFSYIGQNAFTGFLGDDIDSPADGIVTASARGVTRRLQDNNEVRLTQQFTKQDAGDIIITLGTSTAYWKGTGNAYDAPFVVGDFKWTAGSGITKFVYPVWQGQANNMKGYFDDLLNSIGMQLREDGNGQFWVHEPPYRQQQPDRVCIAAPDGDYDVWDNKRKRSGKQMRNIVEVNTGKVEQGAFRTVKMSPSSVKKYGRRRVVITDPIMVEQANRERVCTYILRDYAWNLKALDNKFACDFDVKARCVYGFRAPVRRAKLYAKKKTTVGDAHAQELWTAVALAVHFTVGRWYCEASWDTYVPGGPDVVQNIRAIPRTGVPDTIDIKFDQPLDTSDIAGFQVYLSTTGETGNFTPWAYNAWNGSPTTNITIAVAPLTPGTQYWFYVTSVGPEPTSVEGDPSQIVTAIANTSAGDDSKWTITNLAASFGQVIPPGSPGGLYNYEFYLTWDAPPVSPTAFDVANYGFKHGQFYYNVGSIPSNPQLPQSWNYQDEWHGDRIPPGYGWDYNPGSLYWYMRFTSPVNLSGQTIYFVVFTWQTTNGFGGSAHQSNIVSLTVP